MSAKWMQVTVIFEPEEYRFLEAKANLGSFSVSEFIGVIVRQWIEREKKLQ